MSRESGSGRGLFALLAVVWAMILLFAAVVTVVLVSDSGPDPVTHQYVIPPGTAEKLSNFEEVPGLPPLELNIKVGDTLKIVNNDSVLHEYSFIVVKPGETGEYKFKTKGRFRGACTVGLHAEVVINVT